MSSAQKGKEFQLKHKKIFRDLGFAYADAVLAKSPQEIDFLTYKILAIITNAVKTLAERE